MRSRTLQLQYINNQQRHNFRGCCIQSTTTTALNVLTLNTSRQRRHDANRVLFRWTFQQDQQSTTSRFSSILQHKVQHSMRRHDARQDHVIMTQNTSTKQRRLIYICT